ncbi:hypothetical protein AAMO2058_001042400 [Amorphochlora amoebiformis]
MTGNINLHKVLEKAMYDRKIRLDRSRQVLLTGGSGGAIASFVLGDQIKEKIELRQNMISYMGRKLFFKFRVAPISGLIFRNMFISPMFLSANFPKDGRFTSGF